MIYVSIDTETTGLDRKNDQILEVGAVIEDTEKQLPFDEIPKYSVIIDQQRISGSAYALNLNKRILEILANIPVDRLKQHNYFVKNKIINTEDFALSFFTFLTSNGYEERKNKTVKITTAGKNFASFDKPFLERMPYFTDYIEFSHRSIDPAPLYMDFIKDVSLPSLNICKKRAGIEGEVTHNALEDAWDIVQVLRKKY